ncbi:Acyl transferase/acyl hydrolase/lysophospholipase [Pleurostoma richardsiae]|uniref:Acyl transferase/acyl hydrolase/lysophospholipase n=1 Tax=Pleurostoma richardsiae TaxID=41990 RepID=A0AA38RES6_9PEZI|nr:Acyl transferase/acyl hydrolase/lysophospholipase [Pleurostoma richardsiae]
MTTSSTPLKILSLDGGGIRGISSLLILEDIMETIRDAKGLDHVPRPCEYFDFIGGTSTGGIIAIMLGRLGMTVDACIRAYRKVAQQAFTPKKAKIIPASPSGAFSAKALEAAIRQTVREFCVETACAARRAQGFSTAETCPHGEMEFRETSCTKTAVLAITKDNVDARPILFTTYDTSAALHGCTIWQVARATSAATTFFKPTRVGRDDIEFIDAGFGYNNPCEVLIEEAQRVFRGRPALRVLSVGTGLGEVVAVGKTRRSIINALKRMAASSKKVAARLDDQYGESGQYYRFNVDQGLEDITLSDWEKASRISAHTRNYLSDNQRTIKKFVDGFISAAYGGDNGENSQTAAAAAVELSATRNRSVAGPWYHLPFSRNKRFVGRGETLTTLKQKLFADGCPSVALVGLGGMGKTQVALELTYWTKANRPDCSIFWVPALSEATFEQAYTDIARKLKIEHGDEKDIKKSVRQYLSSEEVGRWLLIVDNADDIELICGNSDVPRGLEKYLPQSENGRILFTTRSRDVAMRVAEEVVKLDEFSLLEATTLLKKSVARTDLIGDVASTTELLQELTYLPLAITQAAAYLERNEVTTAEYLRLLHNTERDMVELLSQELPDRMRYRESKNAVTATWLVSFKKIREIDRNAADLLSFMSQIEPKAIPQSILPGLESEVQMKSAVGTLCGYAFVTKRADMLDMHSLVHLATRIWLDKEDIAAQTMERAMQHIAETFPSDMYENRRLWREYLPHALRILQRAGAEDTERYELCFWVGRCLQVDGRIREAVHCLEECWRWRSERFAEDHPSRLASQHALAIAYQSNGQIKKALALLEKVVAVQKRTLAEDHPDRLASQHVLAMAYRSDGQIKKAVALLEKVVAVRERTLAEDYPDRLASQHELAIAYRSDGQIKKAVALLEKVVAVRERTPAEDHPSRLASQHALAIAYQSDGQIKKAVALLEKVVAVQKGTLAEDHPDRLASQHALAMAYRSDGQIKKAVALLEKVMAVRERTLAEDHPYRLVSQHALAIAYQSDGQIKKAVALLEKVVAVRERTLAEDYPDRLASQHELAMAYRSDGQIKKAVALLEKVMAVRERTLAEDYPDRLASQHALAIAYQSDGQIKKALALLEKVEAVQKRTLAEDYPDRLASQHVLAIAYRSNGQIKKAVALLEQVMAVRERTLAEDYPDRLASQHELAITYQSDGQIKKAVALLEHVVKVKGGTLAEDHPDRLASQHVLAMAYRSDGQIKKAVALLEHVVKVKGGTLAEDHPDRLASQHELAIAYQSDGQIKKAVALLEQVVAVQKRTLAEDHPSRLTAQRNLVGAYRANGQEQKAMEFEQSVAAVHARHGIP